MRSGLLAVAAMASYWPALAHAQNGGDIDLQSFRPAMDSRGYVTVNASELLGPGQVSFGLVTNWGRGVVQLQHEATSYEVTHLLSPTLVGAIGSRPAGISLELGVSVPVTVVVGDRGPNDDGGTPANPNDDQNFRFDSQGLGDLGLHGKVRFLSTTRGARIGLALVGSLYLPTASQSQSWLGEGSSTPQLELVVDKEWRHLSVALNGGVKLRTRTHRFVDDRMAVPSTGETIAAGTSVPLGAAVSYALVPTKVDLVGELFGELPLAGERLFPLEAIAAAKFYLARNSFLTLGGGFGLNDRPGSPRLRAFVGIVFEPNIGDRDGDGLKDDVDSCPDDPEDYDDFEDSDGCPELDNDLDGIVDTDDSCPNSPEDKDDFEDEDGCPETQPLDRDGDGIADEVDQCLDDPEDYDGFEDADGCPDWDNDHDGILDVDDLCPNEPEDMDNWEDSDGCPDPDNDHDRILDIDDSCPDEPENYNNYQDADGCPDRDVVVDTGGTLEILKKVHFEYNKAIIKPESYAILDAVAGTLSDNSEIQLVEVQGHTDERGGAAYNLLLSQRRADAVVKYLVDAGIERSRLASQGYGESQPKKSGHGEQAWAANRRVEFLIIRRESDR